MPQLRALVYAGSGAGVRAQGRCLWVQAPPPRGEPCGKTLPFGFAAIPPVMGNRPVMTHFSALTADVGAGGSIPWLPPASPARRSSWAPRKTLSQVRVTCDHTPAPSKALFQPRLGSMMILCQVHPSSPWVNHKVSIVAVPDLLPCPMTARIFFPGRKEMTLAQLSVSLPRT